MPAGTVKFFNPMKGFGFIIPAGGGEDVFVHISAVQQAGLQTLDDGDEVAFEITADKKTGKPVATSLQLHHPSLQPKGPSPLRSPPGGRAWRGPGARPAAPPLRSGSGVVKWFDRTKGFGFIQPANGGEDVFLHISAVERSGLHSLEGVAVSYDLEQDRRSGKTSAINLRLRS